MSERNSFRPDSFRLGLGAFALAATLVVPAGALTMKRAGLDDLVETNSTIVVATVEGASSRWNDDRTFLLTDYKLATREVLKGGSVSGLTVTLMGGSDGEYTTLIPGGASLDRGKSYVFFLRAEALPGVERAVTIADHSQGVFDVEDRGGLLWATSQAAGEALIPDEEDQEGDVDVPGGIKGMSLEELTRSIKSMVGQDGTGGGK